jgi:hypothetical protein
MRHAHPSSSPTGAARTGEGGPRNGPREGQGPLYSVTGNATDVGASQRFWPSMFRPPEAGMGKADGYRPLI